MTIDQATHWASEITNRNITKANIMYLLQYGRIFKRGTSPVLISKKDLSRYYRGYYGSREVGWRNKLGDDLNWHLSFDYLKEKDTTKHVHRLHPYKGKFIPQLVEYFLDKHCDEFKTESYFRSGDTLLDPFCGSGTTLVEANERGLNAIGIDISSFNSFMSNLKIKSYNLKELDKAVNRITRQFIVATSNNISRLFETELAEYLNRFNQKFFPSPHFSIKVRAGEIDEKTYAAVKKREFISIYRDLVQRHRIQVAQSSHNSFLDRWLLWSVRREIDILHGMIMEVEEQDIKNVLALILSRTLRSCRATTHADLATLKEPITEPYYCRKHSKICRPLFSVIGWWQRYTRDTLRRLQQFASLRTDTKQRCLTGDARQLNIFAELEQQDYSFFTKLKQEKIRGIFSSPPYIGLIDYHEQHAYAYELLGFERQDDLEIGPKICGQGKAARESYTASIAQVLLNCRRFLTRDFQIFIVANDKYDLYPDIAQRAGMRIYKRYKRPVLNRTEKDKGAYSETIFHLNNQLCS